MCARMIGAWLCLAFASGCVVTQNPNAPPGATVMTEDKGISWLPAGLSGGKAGMKGFTRLRVFAPPGASECWSRELFSFTPRGPEDRGRPDKSGAVMLTTQREEAAHITCRTPAGDVQRTVQPQRFAVTMRPGESSSLLEGDPPGAFHYSTLPPLVHMDAANPDLAAHWQALGKELCPPPEPRNGVNGLICAPGILEKLQAVDAAGG